MRRAMEFACSYDLPIIQALRGSEPERRRRYALGRAERSLGPARHSGGQRGRDGGARPGAAQVEVSGYLAGDVLELSLHRQGDEHEAAKGDPALRGRGSLAVVDG